LLRRTNAKDKVKTDGYTKVKHAATSKLSDEQPGCTSKALTVRLARLAGGAVKQSDVPYKVHHGSGWFSTAT
jgi:hypothetical protein